MLNVKQFVFNPFAESTYLLWDSETLDAIVIDPGMSTADERRRFDEFVISKGLKLTGVYNTHLHLDHCLGDNHVRAGYGAKIHAHSADEFLGRNVPVQAVSFGLSGIAAQEVLVDDELKDGDAVVVGSYELAVIHTPGHTPGGVSFYCAAVNLLFAGDSLFQGSIGRTDLPGGDHAALVDSVRTRLFVLPEETTVLPGHGPKTTIAAELAYNPYV